MPFMGTDTCSPRALMRAGLPQVGSLGRVHRWVVTGSSAPCLALDGPVLWAPPLRERSAEPEPTDAPALGCGRLFVVRSLAGPSEGIASDER